MNALEKIRAALESACEIVPLMFATHAKFEEALTALAELERAAKGPAAWRLRFQNGPWVYRTRKPDCSGLQPLYTAPPPAPGMFTAEEIEAAYMEAMLDADSGAADWRKRAEYYWKISSAAKLVRERAK